MLKENKDDLTAKDELKFDFAHVDIFTTDIQRNFPGNELSNEVNDLLNPHLPAEINSA